MCFEVFDEKSNQIDDCQIIHWKLNGVKTTKRRIEKEVEKAPTNCFLFSVREMTSTERVDEEKERKVDRTGEKIDQNVLVQHTHRNTRKDQSTSAHR